MEAAQNIAIFVFIVLPWLVGVITLLEQAGKSAKVTKATNSTGE